MPAFILFRPHSESQQLVEYMLEARSRGLRVHLPSSPGGTGALETHDPAILLRSLPDKIRHLLLSGQWEGQVRFYGMVGDLDLPFTLLSACVDLGMGISVWRASFDLV